MSNPADEMLPAAASPMDQEGGDTHLPIGQVLVMVMTWSMSGPLLIVREGLR